MHGHPQEVVSCNRGAKICCQSLQLKKLLSPTFFFTLLEVPLRIISIGSAAFFLDHKQMQTTREANQVALFHPNTIYIAIFF